MELKKREIERIRKSLMSDSDTADALYSLDIGRAAVPEDAGLSFRHERAVSVVAGLLKPFWQRKFSAIWCGSLQFGIQARMHFTSRLLDEIYQAMRLFAEERFGKECVRSIALIAHGSYARGEFVPGSDFDARLLFNDKEVPEDAVLFINHAAERVFGLATGAIPPAKGIRWGVREEKRRSANVYLLDSRFVGGDFSQWISWRTISLGNLKNAWKAFVQAQRSAWRIRRTKYGPFFDSANLNNLDLKEGLGGLRDLYLVRMIGLARLVAETGDIESLARLPSFPEDRIWAALEHWGIISGEEWMRAMVAYQMLLQVRASARTHKPPPALFPDIARQLGYGAGEEAVARFLDDLRSSREELHRFSEEAIQNRLAHLKGS